MLILLMEGIEKIDLGRVPTKALFEKSTDSNTVLLVGLTSPSSEPVNLLCWTKKVSSFVELIRDGNVPEKEFSLISKFLSPRRVLKN